MTEEIIIDGVNVAGCTYFQQEDDEYTCGAEECNGAVVGCRACDTCTYKQLKRLEQENKSLQAYKDINEDFKKAWDELNEKYKQLRSALEAITEIAEKYKDMEGCRIPLGAIKMTVDEVLND